VVCATIHAVISPSDKQLSTSHTHVPGDRGLGALNGELVPLRLAGEQALERCLDAIMPLGTENVPELDLLIMPEAAVDGSRGGHPDSVAPGAKITAQGRY